LLVTGRTERHHPVEALNNFEMFEPLGANESLLGPDDELAENRIFASKSALNWVICDWSVRKNVQCWVQGVVPGDYTLDLKRARPHGGSSQIKPPTTVEDHRETANTYNSHLI
jgi:hypothetical protein